MECVFCGGGGGEEETAFGFLEGGKGEGEGEVGSEMGEEDVPG